MNEDGRWARLRALVALIAVSCLIAAGCSEAGTNLPDHASGMDAPEIPREAQVNAATVDVDGTVEDERPEHASGLEAPQPPRTAEVPWTPGSWELPPEHAAPAGLWIPRIDVSAPMRSLGIASDGSLEVPDAYDMTGWYAGGPRPGVHGPAVVAGHVDSRAGPAVFSRLGQLQRGDLVHVVYEGGFVSTFVVQAKERVDKDAFPTARVYGNTERPELRLITCGGRFDRSAGSYEDNIVVYGSIYATWRYDESA